MNFFLPCAFLMLCLPGIAVATGADTFSLQHHVLKITEGPGFRNIQDTAALNKVASYIEDEFKKQDLPVFRQSFDVGGKQYHNIIASIGPSDAPRIIVGAHYDVCEEQAGADDNASGVAGLLELAKMLSASNTSRWKYRVDLV